MVGQDGIKSRVKVQRVRCRSCNRSHALLYDFLIPYRQATARAVETAVRSYLLQENSYLDASDDALPEPSSVFTAVESLVRNMSAVWLQLMQRLMDSDFCIDHLSEETFCPNSWRSRSRAKEGGLDLAAWACKLVPSLHDICIAAGICPFGGRRGCTLLRTHRAECMLF